VTTRRYRLSPWLIRALIAPATVGAYVLWDGPMPAYVGRSDNDLRQRLVHHALQGRGGYFSFDSVRSPGQAFNLECSLYHALAGSTTNLIHPARPRQQVTVCAFCFGGALAARLEDVS
jgi:hypothetical protein